MTHVVNFPLCRSNKGLSYYYFCYNYNYVGKYFFFFYSVAHKLLSICFHIWTHMFGDSYHLTFVYHDSPSHVRLCRLSPVHGNVRAFARTAEGSVCEENAATPAQVSAKLHLQSPGNVRMYRAFRIRGEAHTAHAPQLVSVLASLCHVRGRMCKSVICTYEIIIRESLTEPPLFSLLTGGLCVVSGKEGLKCCHHYVYAVKLQSYSIVMPSWPPPTPPD